MNHTPTTNRTLDSTHTITYWMPNDDKGIASVRREYISDHRRALARAIQLRDAGAIAITIHEL